MGAREYRKIVGDNNNVTLVGDSACAGSVSYNLISDTSKNLFQRAILMSGNVFCPWCVMPPNHLSLDLAKATGWNGNGEEKDAYMHLIFVNPEELTKASTSSYTGILRSRIFVFLWTYDRSVL